MQPTVPVGPGCSHRSDRLAGGSPQTAQPVLPWAKGPGAMQQAERIFLWVTFTARHGALRWHASVKSF